MSQFYINTKYKAIDRFDMAKFLEFENDGFNVTNSEFLDELKSIPEKGVYQVIAEAEAPWLVAYTLYGDSSLFWIILYYNDLQTETELVSGTVVAYPDLALVDRLLFGLKAKQTRNT